MLWNPANDLDQIGKELYCMADFLDRNGWCRYDLYGRDGVCMHGAHMMTASSVESLMKLENYIKATKQVRFSAYELENGISHIAQWNDHFCKDKAEAVQVCRDAAHWQET